MNQTNPKGNTTITVNDLIIKLQELAAHGKGTSEAMVGPSSDYAPIIEVYHCGWDDTVNIDGRIRPSVEYTGGL